MVVGRVALVGDAAFIPRPHTAASTSKAAANALSLGQALSRFDDVEAAFRAWEPEQLELGQQLEERGQALGNRSQFATSRRGLAQRASRLLRLPNLPGGPLLT